MSPNHQPSGRETRLLLLIVAVSAAALLVLAQFRFPEQPGIPVPPPTPLGRLAARATYDELASILGDVERRLAPAIVALRLEASPSASRTLTAHAPAVPPPFVPGLRIRPEAVVAQVGPDENVTAIVGSNVAPTILFRDPDRRLALVQVPPLGDTPDFVSRPVDADRERYVAVIEATSDGPTARPGFLGPTWARRHVLWDAPLRLLPGGLSLTPGALVFSLDARLVGLGVVAEDGAIALAPAASLRAAIDELERGAPAASGDLGVEIGPLTPALSAVTGAATGVVVASVRGGGPTGESLAFGDVVEAIDGMLVQTPYDFGVLVRRAAPGTPVVLSVVRRGERREVSLSVGAAPQPAEEGTTAIGLTMRTRSGAGAEVLRVGAGSAAERAGLRPGDVITQLEDRARPTPADVTRRYARAEPGQRLLLGVARDGRSVAIVLEKPR